jgi:hypothetical protein
MSRRSLVTNPPWATEAVAHAYPQMQLAFRHKAQWLPEFRDVTFGGRNWINASVKEYGCGAYGCVFPTMDPGVVLKVTTDDTEAQFADLYASTLVMRVTVDYHAVMPLNTMHNGRNIHLLWRESAQHVGDIDDYTTGDPIMALNLIKAQHEAAQVAFLLIMKVRDMQALGEESSAIVRRRDQAIERWQAAAEAMGRVDDLRFLGHGMNVVYEEQGIFFGDVHEGNIGMVTRDGESVWVITDPGHVAVMT